MEDLKTLIRSIPDFPQKGILFRDITTLIKDKEHFKIAIDELGARYIDKKIDSLAAIEARGFIIAGALAHKLGCAIIPVRKKGKLPAETYQVTYDLEYGTDTLEVHRDAIKPKDRVLIVDDLLATGGTARAVIDLVNKLQGEIVELTFLIELTDLKGREKLKDYPVFSLIKY
ncbi:MAG: adenine phosphoribosyltransferase [Candidatus Omnitrophota bacterium]|nr:adenine phosphoribosyltransferase [Candidatus Omnitrophota bacterium]